MGTLWGREPALVVGVLQALLALATGFGLSITAEQAALIMGVAAAVLAFVTRSQVSPAQPDGRHAK